MKTTKQQSNYLISIIDNALDGQTICSFMVESHNSMAGISNMLAVTKHLKKLLGFSYGIRITTMPDGANKSIKCLPLMGTIKRIRVKLEEMKQKTFSNEHVVHLPANTPNL